MLGTCLPSSDSAQAVVNGDTSAIPRMLLHLAGRTLLISAGVYAIGQRKDVMKISFGASLAIETFAIGYFLWLKNNPDSAIKGL